MAIRVLHAFCLKGGGGGHFEVKEGHPDFLQITCSFLNAVLLLYLKLFTFLEIITMLKLSFEILYDFISSCSAQVTISQEVKILKFHFLNLNIIIFDALILK